MVSRAYVFFNLIKSQYTPDAVEGDAIRVFIIFWNIAIGVSAESELLEAQLVVKKIKYLSDWSTIKKSNKLSYGVTALLIHLKTNLLSSNFIRSKFVLDARNTARDIGTKTPQHWCLIKNYLAKYFFQIMVYVWVN